MTQTCCAAQITDTEAAVREKHHLWTETHQNVKHINEIKQMLSSEIMMLSELTLVQMCSLSSSARRQLTGELVHLLSDIRISAQVSWTSHSEAVLHPTRTTG